MKYYLVDNQGATNGYYSTFVEALESAKLYLAISGDQYINVFKIATNGNRLFVRRITRERS